MKPIIYHEYVVNLIGNTSTRKGLKIRAVLDENEYETGREVTENELAGLNLNCDKFHPEWNYTIMPRNQTPA